MTKYIFRTKLARYLQEMKTMLVLNRGVTYNIIT